jgi:SAM-dependent methyltransferase
VNTQTRTARENHKYGTVQWFQREYGRVIQDPWGLGWRGSQLLRYHRTLAALEDIDEPITRVLDVGCATGDFTYLLSRRLPHLTTLIGVDFASRAVERARRRFPDLTFATDSLFSVADTFGHAFDIVVCLEVMYYVERDQQRAALRALKRALRPGGYAIFSSVISPPPHFSPNELQDLVRCEFELVRTEILHLRVITAFEKVAHRSQILLSRYASIGRKRLTPCLGRVPFAMVVAIEQACRPFRSLSASHSIVLARTR